MASLLSNELIIFQFSLFFLWKVNSVRLFLDVDYVW